jgi:glycosyltransferase involved in cell wall biosynthesis
MISFLFPPMGGAGVQRTLKFTKYLPEFGWEPNILTVRPTRSGLRDEGLLNQIPAGTPVTRTAAVLPPPQLPWRVRDFISRWLLTVDEQVGWMPFAIHEGRRMIQKSPVEIIYSTSAPYTAHLIARRLHQRTNIPWVADFRDPWIGNSNLNFPTSLHRKTVERLERQVVQEANHVLVISPPMAQSFCERIREVDRSKFTWLPNGFDADDFSNAQPAQREKDRFLLVHSGSFYTHGRTSRSILESVHWVTSEGLIPRERLRLCLVGNIGKATQKWISELNLTDIVETPGYVPHDQSIAYLLSADVLLLIIGNSPDSAAVYTGKVFEYLASGKLILCLANEGVASDLIRKARAGVIVPSDDVSLISKTLVEMYKMWQNGSLSTTPDKQFIQTFERKQLTGQLARIFDDLTGKTV